MPLRCQRYYARCHYDSARYAAADISGASAARVDAAAYMLPLYTLTLLLVIRYAIISCDIITSLVLALYTPLIFFSYDINAAFALFYARAMPLPPLLR